MVQSGTQLGGVMIDGLRRLTRHIVTAADTSNLCRSMDKLRMVGNIDTYDGQQNLEEWTRMVERTATFAGWTEDNKFKAALFRLRGEASEHIEQLKSEGQINTWEEAKKALKARFEPKGKEQLYQHLLNTGTQGTKSVQEWAQVVRKLSLNAMGGNDIKTEGAPAQGEGENAEAAQRQAADKEATKAILSYMRKNNFIRGLRSNLRQAVWRKKCETFDEAVRIAADEEAIEMAHKEEEVINCFQEEYRNMTSNPLVNSIVAALDAREAAKEVDNPRLRNTAYRRGTDTIQYKGARVSGTAGNQYTPKGRQNYDEQLPLPRNDKRNGPTTSIQGQGQQWYSTRYAAQPETEEERRDREEYRCYRCHQTGHIRRFCPELRSAQHPGNGPRRLN